MSCHYLDSGEKACCTDRETTEHTDGVWTTCDDCEHDWWCVVTQRDDLDEPLSWSCSGGCDDGFENDPTDQEATR
jgi:hypothetical protein